MNINIKDKKQRRESSGSVKDSGYEREAEAFVFRSNKFFYAQLIDDANGKTILGVSQKHLSLKTGKKEEQALELGKLIGQKASAKKIKEVLFDRGAYKYHGRVKAFAKGAKEGGLVF